MREDFLLEEIINYFSKIGKSIGSFFKHFNGMWQTQEEGKYPDDKGFRYTARFFIFLAILFLVPTSLVANGEVTLANKIFLFSLLYNMIFFCLGSLLAHLLDFYLYNKAKRNFWKIPLGLLGVLLFIPMLPYVLFFSLVSLFIIFFNLNFDTFTASSGILGLDIVVISVISIIFQKPFDGIIEQFIIFLNELLKTDIKYKAVILFIVIIIYSFLIKYYSKLFDWLLFRKKYDTETRRQSLNLIYVCKLAVLTYIFAIITFTVDLGDIEDETINVITFITLIILLKDKMGSMFLKRKEAQEFKVQIEWKNNGEETIKEEINENYNNSDENSEEIDEKEEPVTVEKNNTLVEPAKYDSSTIKQPSYKYIRTHKIPNNKRIYKFRKKKMKISFFNK